MQQTKIENEVDGGHTAKVEAASPDRVLSAGSDPYMGGVVDLSPAKHLDLKLESALPADSKDHGHGMVG